MPAGTVVLEQIASRIQKVYSGALARTLNETSPAYSLLSERGKIVTDTRNEYRWPSVDEAYDGVNNINDGEDLPDADYENYADALLKPKIFIGLIRVGRMLQLGSKNNEEYFASKEGSQVLSDQVNAAMRQIARQIHLQIVADAAVVKGITSLGDAVGKDDNTYANINRVGNTFWQPYVNDNGGVARPLTETLLRDMHDTITETRGGNTSEVWCGTTAWNALADLLEPRVRTSDPNNLRGGAASIDWRGIPFIRMPDQTPGTMYWFDHNAGEGILLKKQHDEDFIVRPEATSSYDDRMSIAAHYEIIVHDPSRQGSLKDLV